MSNVKNILKATAISAFVVPAMGLAAHMIPNKGKFFLDDAKLSHRFECAYNINPDVTHRYYLSREYIEHPMDKSIRSTRDLDDGTWIEPGQNMDVRYNAEHYSASPILIYPMHFAIAALAFAALRRKEKFAADKKLAIGYNQKTR